MNFLNAYYVLGMIIVYFNCYNLWDSFFDVLK